MRRALKTWFTGILLASLTAVFCIPAAAETEEGPAPNELTVLEDEGLNLDFDRVNDKTTNSLNLSEIGIVSRDPFIAAAELDYSFLTKEAVDELSDSLKGQTEEKQEELRQFFQSTKKDIAYIVTTTLSDPKELLDQLFDEPEKLEAKELGQAGELHYYVVLVPYDSLFTYFDDSEEDAATIQKEIDFLKEDIEQVLDEFQNSIAEAEFYQPVDEIGGLVGKTIEFEAVDLDGNTIKSEDLFKDNQITMLNVWGTWCGNCMGEMEALADLHSRLQEKGCGLVGIEFEYQDRSAWEETARDTIETFHIDYPNVLMPEGHPILDLIKGYPTTIFVDSEGKVLSVPIEGANVEAYEPTIDSLLAGKEPETVTDAGSTANDENKYRVLVYDEEGSPVEGVFVQMCDDQSCSFQVTNQDGIAEFTPEQEHVYEVHLQAVPDGYAPDENAYHTLETYSDVNIFLQKAAE